MPRRDRLALFRSTHGYDRAREIEEANGTALVVERAGRTTGFATGFGYFDLAVGEANSTSRPSSRALARWPVPGSILVPSRNSELMRWCLEHGLRVIHPMTLMSVGFYQEPTAPYLPTVNG